MHVKKNLFIILYKLQHLAYSTLKLFHLVSLNASLVNVTNSYTMWFIDKYFDNKNKSIFFKTNFKKNCSINFYPVQIFFTGNIP